MRKCSMPVEEWPTISLWWYPPRSPSCSLIHAEQVRAAIGGGACFLSGDFASERLGGGHDVFGPDLRGALGAHQLERVVAKLIDDPRYAAREQTEVVDCVLCERGRSDASGPRPTEVDVRPRLGGRERLEYRSARNSLFQRLQGSRPSCASSEL